METARATRRSAALAVAALALAACAPDSSEVVAIGRATLAFDGPSGAGTDRVLPDAWSRERRAQTTRSWYRAGFELAEPPAELWAVYLPRVDLNAAVFVNGARVGDGGSLARPMARNRNRPLLYSVPRALLRVGGNEVTVELGVEPSSMGLLEPFYVGPRRLLEPSWRVRTFLQVTLIQATQVGAVAVAALIALYLRRDPTRAYRWFLLSIVAWVGWACEFWVREVPLPAWGWEALTSCCLYAGLLCLMRGFHRAFDRPRRRRERFATLGLALALGSFAVASEVDFTALRVVWGALFTALAGYLIWFVTRAPGLGQRLMGRQLVPGGVFGVAVAGHDIVSALAGRPLLGAWLVPYNVLGALLVTAWAILENLLQNLDETRRLTVELERRVGEKQRELEANHTRVRTLERERAVSHERQRILRDMHDGMGAQLVSALAMVEGGGRGASDVADALRDALDDLRLAIDSLSPVDGDLLATLGLVRSRLAPRLARQGIRIDWQVHDLPALPGLGADQSLHALRIVQECLANIVKHAGASVVVVRTGAAPRDGRAGVFLEIADDGRGFDAGRPAGRGLHHMRERASALGGRLGIETSARGTCVTLWLPV
ncbi:MAG: histidine kinase [Myxococcota bacterium]|nr:histidine kinase [Myxococcota bacterium]